MRTRLALAIVTATFGALAFTAQAGACSCVAIDVPSQLQESDAAIVGRLVKVVPRGGAFGPADFQYRVKEVFKGENRIRRGKVLSVRSNGEEAACGLPQKRKRDYGLFLSRTKKRWTGNLCGVVEPRQLRDPTAPPAAVRGSRCRAATRS